MAEELKSKPALITNFKKFGTESFHSEGDSVIASLKSKNSSNLSILKVPVQLTILENEKEIENKIKVEVNSKTESKSVEQSKFLTVSPDNRIKENFYDKNKSENKLLMWDPIIKKINEEIPNSTLNKIEAKKQVFYSAVDLNNNINDDEENIGQYETWDEYRKLGKRDKINESDTEESESETEKNITWIILPDNNYKRVWDIFIAILIMYSAVVTPYRIAFVEHEENDIYSFLDFFIDFSFFIDLILNFFSAYYDNEENVITKRKKIIYHYVKTWFVIDLLSIIPINFFLGSENPFSTISVKRISNSIGKIARIPRLYRLVKLTKLFRMIKIVKKGNVNRITDFLVDKLKVSANIERLIYFILAFLVLNHLSACIWYLVAKLEDFGPDCWVTRLGFIDYEPLEIYIVSFYWSLATVTTVGYGDVSAGTSIERIYNLFIMSFGVFMYSFAIGSLSSIVSTLDAKTSEMNQKLQTLYSIRHEFKLDQDIYDKVRKVIKYDLSRNQKDKMNFLQELPNKLRIELSQIIHDNIIKKMHFFKDQQPDLIAFVAPLLKPIKLSQNELLYKINDTMDEMYFINKGTISFNLSEVIYSGKEIKEVKKNNNFGEIEMCLNEKLSHNVKVKSRNAELLVLKKIDFLQFSSNYKEFIEKFLQKSLIIYLKFNDEKKKIIKEFEEKNKNATVISLNPMKEDDDELEKISEKDEDNVSEEHNIYGNSDSDNSKNSSNQNNEDKSEENFEGNIQIINLKDKSNNVDQNITSNLVKNTVQQVDKKKSILKNKMSEKDLIVVNTSNVNNQPYDVQKEFSHNSINNISSNIITTPEIFNNVEDNFKEMNSTLNPILEMEHYVDKIKEDLFNEFNCKSDKIIKFFEEHKVTFDHLDKNNNPIILLQKLMSIKEINERNEIIDELENAILNLE